MSGTVNRLQQLKQFLEEDPADPFAHYALALEYLKTEPRKAAEIFEHLITHHPQYLPTYYPYAHLMAELNNGSRAEELFRQGIALAAKQNNNKARLELSNAYLNWQADQ